MTVLPGDHISLFSGVGMFDYAADARGFHTLATAEIDPWCRKVLAVRMPDAVHYQDVRDVKAGCLRVERPLLITGGFPCQDINSSGTGLGLEGERSGLVHEQLRIIREFQPEYALFENSSLLTKRGLNVILSELVRMHYHVRWECIPAAIVDAPHMRDRCWIMARRTPFTLDQAVEIGDFYAAPELIPTELPRSGITHWQALYETAPLVTRRTARINAEAVHGKLMPTPTKSDGSGGPGTTPKRTGGKNLRTVVAEEEGSGRLDPNYVEWMMGLPLGWTNPEIPNWKLNEPLTWRKLYPGTKTVPNRAVPDRGRRIQALGNGLVPQVATLALDLLIND